MKSFSLKSYLKSHVEVVHSGIKKHKCEKCSNSFVYLNLLKKHFVKVHSNTEED